MKTNMKGQLMNLQVRSAALGLLALLGGCAQSGTAAPPPTDDVALATQVTDALLAACPMSARDDEAARHECASRLSENKFLAGVMAEPFLWGGQKTAGDYHFANSNMNKFNVLVWRRMYLSLMMFPGERTIEQTPDGLTVVHVPYAFRNALEMGSYPYPFWHSKKKWDSYEQSTEMLLVFQNGKWQGAMRNAALDPTHPHVGHTWSGQWRWETGSQEQPYVSLYKYLLSPSNPHTERVDAAYRELSTGLRAQSCFMCHSPDNYAASTSLEFFNYPNQALYARNDIITNLLTNAMPPANNTLGLPAGIASEADRTELLGLARAFKAAGDDALAYEGELKGK
ncbi:MAG: hypothetical protein JWM82_1989 [Myxococcales bacterium]|nr:hypothetical protein [Myxococcales bacterium]